LLFVCLGEEAPEDPQNMSFFGDITFGDPIDYLIRALFPNTVVTVADALVVNPTVARLFALRTDEEDEILGRTVVTTPEFPST
jgi:hypothetical protein